MKEIKACGFLIVRGDPIEQFLLMEHKDRLDLPKGHVDPGESEMECALRELQEETGIAISDIEVDDDFRFTTKYTVESKRDNYRTCLKTVVLFLGRLVREVEIQLTEHAGYRWEKWNPPHTLDNPTIDPLLQHLATHLKSK